MICELVEQLSQITDVYYGLGNHETAWILEYGDCLKAFLTEAGAIVLNNEYWDTNINGNPIRLAGYMGYYRAVNMTTHTKEAQQAELEFMDRFENTERYKILLDHIPTSWVDWDYINKYPVDLIFSGHYHGGLVQLPIINRGLYAPYVGWLPKYTKGVFSGTKATCILSAGLGLEYLIPRINNSPEIVVVDLTVK